MKDVHAEGGEISAALPEYFASKVSGDLRSELRMGVLTLGVKPRRIPVSLTFKESWDLGHGGSAFSA